jgi:F-type H+-transporting ATPase subunit delta
VIQLGGNSRQSLATLRDVLDEKLKGLSSADCTAVSTDLFIVLNSLNSSIGLRRALTDPSRDVQSKSVLLNDLFESVVSKQVLALLVEVVSARWSSPVDVASAVEQLAIEAEATAANADGVLDRVQDELFVFSRSLAKHQELRQILGDRVGSAEGKRELIASLVGGKAAPSTVRLLTHLVSGLAWRSIDTVEEIYIDAVAARRNRLIVLVITRSPVSAAQAEKLSSVMSKQVGQPVHLNFQIDPSVIGGVSIRFADEIVDGTISTRLTEAGRALAV